MNTNISADNSSINLNVTNQYSIASMRTCNKIPDLRVLSHRCPEEELDLEAVDLSASVQTTRQKHSFATMTDVEKYCRKRLDELMCMNCKFPTVSAFSALFSYIGFLANLVYRGEKTGDGDQFRSFCKEYIKNIKVAIDAINVGSSIDAPKKKCRCCGSVMNNEADTSLANVLYGYLRCGLVHAMSVDNPSIANSEKIVVKIGHAEINEAKQYEVGKIDLIKDLHGDGAMSLQSDQVCELKINAFDVVDAIDGALKNMFTSSDIRYQKLLQNASQQMPVI